MSTHFTGEGNIGSPPEFHEFPNEQDESDPHRKIRFSVYFDNPKPTDEGFEDRGGFWASVDLWDRDAQRWSKIYQKGMRVLVSGRIVRDEWRDDADVPRVTLKIEAKRVGILPYRIDAIAMAQRATSSAEDPSALPPARS